MVPPDVRSGRYMPSGDNRMFLVDAEGRTPSRRTLADFETPDGALRDAWKPSVYEVLRFFNVVPPSGQAPFHERWEPHENSDGRYHVEYETIRYDGVQAHVYAYTLDENATTSSHRHPPGVTETLVRIDGIGNQVINGDNVPLQKTNVVVAGCSHQVTTKDTGSAVLMVAITYNPDRIPTNQLHIYDNLPSSAVVFSAEGTVSQVAQ